MAIVSDGHKLFWRPAFLYDYFKKSLFMSSHFIVQSYFIHHLCILVIFFLQECVATTQAIKLSCPLKKKEKEKKSKPHRPAEACWPLSSGENVSLNCAPVTERDKNTPIKPPFMDFRGGKGEINTLLRLSSALLFHLSSCTSQFPLNEMISVNTAPKSTVLFFKKTGFQSYTIKKKQHE